MASIGGNFPIRILDSAQRESGTLAEDSAGMVLAAPSVMKQFTLVLLCGTLGALGCSDASGESVGQDFSTANVSFSQGILDCFDPVPATVDASGQTKPSPTCEASAVAFDGTHVFVGSDKTFPSGTPMLLADLGETGALETPQPLLDSPAISGANKIEGLTTTPDGKLVVATTGFDRVDTTNKFDAYNTLVAWPVGKPQEAKVVSATSRAGITSSVNLREQFARALASEAFPEGPSYFKVEGLAAIPGDRLLVGVREVGSRYDSFEYVAVILSVSYEIREGTIELNNDMRVTYRFDPKAFDLPADIAPKAGLSSLEYDPYQDALLILTSYEKGSPETISDLGGYLWSLPLSDLDSDSLPAPLQAQQGTPLFSSHKPEGLAVLDNRKLLVVFDDDRVVNGKDNHAVRTPNQAFYTVIEFE